MSLLQQYSAFLARPGEEHLLATATLSYVPTLTTLTGASAVVRHLAAQAKALHKKSETVLTAVAGVEADGQTLVVEMDTTLEFLSGGGAYLPGLDDNFVAGRLAAFPITHFVHFRGQQISSVRLAWDQGSLLKQIDVIGSRGRNWPIRDGKDQARLIASIARASTAPLSSQPDGPSAAADSARGRAYSGKGATADPHATLSLFQSEEEHRAAAAAAPTTRRQNDDSSSRPAVAPRQSAKPPSRDYGALFAGADSEPAAASGLPGPGHGQGDGYGGQARAVAATPVKAGAGKNFRPNRLFEETAEERAAAVPDKFRANPHKYSHFEFGEPDADATPRARAKRQSTDEKAAKHSSQWDFTDFATPSKPAAKVNSHNVRHFGWSDDEDGDNSPVKRPVVHQPRPDANSHFDIVDDGPASAGKTQRPQRASGTSKQRSGLYSETVFGDDHGGGSGDARPTSASSSGSAQPGQARNSCSTAGHQRNFGSQFEMTDDSPVPPKRFTEASQPSSRPGGDKQNSAGPYHAGPDRAAANGGTVGQRKVLQGLNANWQMHDDSPESGAGLKENQPIHAAGPKAFDDGAGQKKANALNWSIGGPDGDADADADAARLPDRSKAAEPLQRRNRNESQLSGDFWEF